MPLAKALQSKPIARIKGAAKPRARGQTIGGFSRDEWMNVYTGTLAE